MGMRFSQVIQKVFLHAQEEDAGGGNAGVSTEHILLGLLGVPEGDAWEVLSKHGLGEGLQAEMRGRLGIAKPQLPLNEIRVTPGVRGLFVASMELARSRNEALIRSGHLLAALLGTPDDPAAALLLAAGLQRNAVVEALDQPSTET